MTDEKKLSLTKVKIKKEIKTGTHRGVNIFFSDVKNKSLNLKIFNNFYGPMNLINREGNC